jgi:gamma-glutamyltranspeptidase/glutathione hydrolase
MSKFLYIFSLLVVIFSGDVWAKQHQDTFAPEDTYAYRGGLKDVSAKEHMVVTPHLMASFVANEMLKRGGNAMDAAIAASFILTLVEPQSSGIGGGGIMLYYDNSSKNLHAYDGREMSPASARSDMFLNRNGEPRDFLSVVTSGDAVGVPTQVHLLEYVHEKHAKLPWYDLVMPTSRLSTQGFQMYHRLHDSIKADNLIKEGSKLYDYFYPNGKLVRVGATLKNPALAKTMEKVAVNGSKAFYYSQVADGILEAVRNTKQSSSGMTIDDFASYRVEERNPLCDWYKQNIVCGFPAPSSGGMTVLQVLNMMESFNIDKVAPYSPEALDIITQALALSMADRDTYVADPKFSRTPIENLITDRYIKSRVNKIKLSDFDVKAIKAGQLYSYREKLNSRSSRPVLLANAMKSLDKHVKTSRAIGKFKYANYQNSHNPSSTSHISVVDKWGNAASLTQSIEHRFGSHIMTDGGFILNNQLADFSFVPRVNGKKVANAPAPRKRPRTSMSPVIVFAANGEVKLVTGSPGGINIPAYVVRNIIDVVDWGYSPQQSANNPNYAFVKGKTRLEQGRYTKDTLDQLADRGHDVDDIDMNSGINSIKILNDGTLLGATDPRRSGQVLGH